MFPPTVLFREMNICKIKLYGTARCHKTKFYQSFFQARNIPYSFYDVEADVSHAKDLRNLYSSGKLNFPTITIGKKRLRNPNEKELAKWIAKVIE